MLYVPKVNCMYLRYRDAWNTSRYLHKFNSKSLEYCLRAYSSGINCSDLRSDTIHLQNYGLSQSEA